MKIGDKTFLNLQEAVAWLLENNALPYQSTANYVANTEIAMSTLINPSPAKVRVGSIIFFADSKVATVIGVTSNSFIVSDQYNDLVDDVVYVSNVAIDASGHLICTLSNGDTIDAGLIKQVTSLNIDASQHLVANYNDGSTTDLGAIFTGNVNIAGNLTADSIIENMTGYTFTKYPDTADYSFTLSYAGICKNGNKITFVVAGQVTKLQAFTGQFQIGTFTMPSSIGSNLYPYSLSPFTDIISASEMVYWKTYDVAQAKKHSALFRKSTNTLSYLIAYMDSLDVGTPYIFRYEVTFLLSDNLAS